MTTKNAILLIVKQNNGIDYNSLLNKFATSYSNINSARAALSRSLKDLSIFGFIARKGNRYFILEKGESEIYSALKNKLVLGLNSSMAQKHPENEVDSIVSKLQVLIERSKDDRDLLKTSKSSIGFSITDLDNVGKKLEKKVTHLKYLSKVLSEQVNSLKEMDFNDSFARPLAKESVSLIVSIFSSFNEKEFVVECSNKDVLEKLENKFKVSARNNSFSIKKSSFKELAKFMEKNKDEFALNVVTVFSSSLKTQFYNQKIFLSGPYSETKKWKG